MKRILIALLILVMTMAGSAQEVISPALQDQIDHITATTSELRGLAELEPVSLVFPTKDELAEYVQTVFDEEIPPEVIETESLFYVAFGFMSPDVELFDLLVALYTDQIGGFYDAETNTMNVILLTGDQPSDELPVLEEIIFSHEYVHALQDQHFDLAALLEVLQASEEPDFTLAAQAVFEGDATYTMTNYMIDLVADRPEAAGKILAASNVGGPNLMEGVPKVIEQELLWPYLQGMSFITYLFDTGGWELVNNAFTDLPASTEQVYHPDRYLNGDEPIPVELAGREMTLGEGWERTHDRTFGEFYLRQYLNTYAGGFSLNTAATGWGGDRYHIYHNAETGELAWAMRLTMDTVQDADEFEAAYMVFGENRFGVAVQDGCWSDDSGALCVVRENDSTLLLTSAPSLELAESLLVEP